MNPENIESLMNRQKMALNEEIPDEWEDQPEPYEETYRDGSAKNEGWRDRPDD